MSSNGTPKARNLTFALIDRAQSHPQASALLLADRVMSYQQLNQMVWTFSQRLHDQGLRPGDLLGLAFSNPLALVLTLLGAMRLGATAFSIPQKSNTAATI